jgi:hypothetical protein
VGPLPLWGGQRLSPIELCATHRDQGERATSKPAAITSSPRETPGRAVPFWLVPRPGAKSAHGELLACRLHLIVLDLLDFALSGPRFRSQTRFRCWIFVGFRAALNMCSHPGEPRKCPLTCSFASWAVTGSNRRPLRCKRGSAQTRYLRERPFSQLRTAFWGGVQLSVAERRFPGALT